MLAKSLWPFVLVGLGGLFGSVARYALSLLLQRHAVPLPLGTLSANLAGCFVIGVLMQLAALSTWVSPESRLFLATGFCGGFTTLSSLIYELSKLLRDGEWFWAVVYFNVTFLGAVAAYYIGGLSVKLLLNLR